MTRQDKAFAPARPSGLCVEFFGLPGSGKTTIARVVSTMLAQSDPGLIFAPNLLADEAGAAKRAAAKLRLVLSGLGRSAGQLGSASKAFLIRQPRLRDKLRAATAIATATAVYRHADHHQRQVIQDQGVLQALWSVQLRATGGNVGALVDPMLKEAAGSGRIHISVETPTRVCAERLGMRASKHSRMQTSAATQDANVWETAELLRRTLLGNLRAAYRKQGIAPRIIVVDGTADPISAARQIVAGLARTRQEMTAPQSQHLREVIA